MSEPDQPEELFATPSGVGGGAFTLWVVLDAVNGGFRFEWLRAGATKAEAVGFLGPNKLTEFRWFALDWEFQLGGRRETDQCNRASPSVRALLKRS